MCKIGLLAEYDDSYQFKAYYNKDNKCKQYAYSYDTEQQIKEYCKNSNINKYQIINITIVNKFAVDKILNIAEEALADDKEESLIRLLFIFNVNFPTHFAII